MAEKVSIIVVVNGAPTTVEANESAPLQSIVEKALHETNNAGQDPNNWEFRDAAGALLDMKKKIGDFGFSSDVKLFLNLKAGIGG
jgi:hypothetical protein